MRQTRLLAWSLLVLLALWQVFFRAHYETDIGAFLPDADGVRQQVLVTQIQQGNASRLWMLAVTGERSRLAAASREFRALLEQVPELEEVRNGSDRLLDQRGQEVLFRYRFLLQPTDFSVAALREALRERQLELASPMAAFKENLIGKDPADTYLTLLQRLEQDLGGSQIPKREGVWSSADGRRALLLARSRAASMDAEAQQRVETAIHAAFRTLKQRFAAANLRLETAGAPKISLHTSQQIRATSLRLSLLAGVFLIAILWFALRNPLAILLNALPPLLGVLFATAVSSFGFGSLHILTLAFGITILGVALDYPLHILVHQRPGERLLGSARRVWPILLAGVLTTVIAFLAFTLTDFEGIRRLGVFAAVGLLMAALSSRYLLPLLADSPGFKASRLPMRIPRTVLAARFPAAGFWLPVAIFVALSGWGVSQQVRFSDDIRSLSPVPAVLLAEEQTMRDAMGLAQEGIAVLVRADSIDGVLREQTALLPLLEVARAAGEIESWEMAAQLLPDSQSQSRRQRALPDSETLARNLNLALQGLELEAGAFTGFLRAVEESRELPPLSQEMLADTALGEWLRPLLIRLESSPAGSYAGLIRLRGITDREALAVRLAAHSRAGVSILDSAADISRALENFRLELSRLLLISAVVMVLVLLLLLKRPLRVAKIVLIVAAATLGSAWFSFLLLGSLNLLHLIALLLVVGISIDYALFFTAAGDTGSERGRTFLALSLCLLSSSVVFLLLAGSGIPVLTALGTVVSIGVLLAFAFAWLAAVAGGDEETC